MDYDKITTLLTEDIVSEFTLLGHEKFIKDRIILAYGAGFDMGRSQLRHQKPIVQLSIEGGFIKEWNSAAQAGRSLRIDSSAISAVCKKRVRKDGGTLKTAGKYKWEYTKDYYARLEQEKEDIITKRLEYEKHNVDG